MRVLVIPDIHLKTWIFDREITFAEDYPDTLWSYGNHDVSYPWGRFETGYSPYAERMVIIDAKYYERNLREQFGKVSIPTGNLYQIFTYVKTKENELAEVPHEKVAGMLLYAQTEEEGKFNNAYQMMGNPICGRTLDLSGDFSSIKKQLNEIAEKYLLVKAA